MHGSKPLLTNKWGMDQSNFIDEIRAGLNLPKKVIIHDITLRDAEQQAGLVFSYEERNKIARFLDELGFHRIEAIMPAVAKKDEKAVKVIECARAKLAHGLNMRRFKILLTDKIDRAGIEIMEKVAEVNVASGHTEDKLAKEATDVDAIVVRVPAVITRKIIDSARALKVIARFGVGYDNIDVIAATERGIPVTYTPGANTLAVAEYTIALVFSLAKQIMRADRALREHKWEMRLTYSGIELAGKTLGIVGLGEIGSEVAELSRALGMQVLYSDPVRRKEKESGLGIQYVPLTDGDENKGLRVPERLLNGSDFISVHSALTEQTRGFIGEKEIAAMKDGAFLINTARGELVDEEAAYNALRKGKLAGAGLDVFKKEPPCDSPLLGLENVIVTPHVAALARDALKMMSIMVAEDTVRVLNKEIPAHLVNPQVLETKLG